VAIAAVALVATDGRPAGAVEREHHVGADLGGTMLMVNNKSSPDVGGGVGAHWTYGLSDAFNLMVEATWSLVAIETLDSKSTPRNRPTWVGNADVGVAYVFDVLTWVPYAGLLVGGYALDGGTIRGTVFLGGLSIAAGLDYRLSRSFAIGVALRQHMVTDPNTYPSLSQAFARAEYTWGW
jgi:hypothetical protein